MKKWVLLLISLMIITGCAINKPAPKSNPNLPKVTNFKAYPDRNAMALKWNAVKGIKGYFIQKFDFKTKKWGKIITLKDPYQTLYVDTDLKPNTLYRYRIATFDKNKIPSLAVETEQKTLPTVAPVIPLEIKRLTKGEVKIIFRPHPNERVNSYIIQRFNDEKAKWENIATLKPRYNVEYIDKGLVDGKIYKYRIIAVTFDDLYSAPSQELTISTYPKPPVVMNVKATVDLPKKIQISWTPVKDAAYYKIYKKKFLIFVPIAKTKNTFYIDKIDKDGDTEYYKVTAVSIHQTESLLDKTPEVMGKTLDIPAKPIVSTNVTDNGVEFIMNSPDNRAVKYLVVKELGNILNKKEQKYLVNGNRFLDKEIDKKHSVTYKIYAIDKYGLISKPTEVEVSF
ncbi:fibronectin type III domain-containing protein [Lebetimonas natsushimae]|nr:fibronectin type III domain-containing protein [Lebetimonas natsushimae]